MGRRDVEASDQGPAAPYDVTTVERAQETAASLLRRAGPDPAPLLVEAVAELQATLEELAVAVEELRQQHDDLVESQDALDAERRHFRELFDQAPDAYLLTDEHGMIRAASQAAKELLDPDGPPLVGRPIATLVTSSERGRFRSRLTSAGRGVTQRDWTFGAAGRSNAAVQVSAEVGMGVAVDGQTPELRWLLRDVSGARRAQRELRERYRSTLRQADELRERDRWKDAFMSAAAHDLRTPLAVISTAAETLLARPDVDVDRRTQMVRVIAGQSDRLKRLLDDLLDLSRYAQGRVTPSRRPVDVTSLIEDAVAAATVPGLDLSVDVQPGRANLDRTRVEQIIVNLVRNAAAHTPSGTPVHLSATFEADRLVLVIEDEGPGLDTGLGDRIFDPFVTQPRHPGAERGTGLGLSLVQLFAELHGGTARAEDRPGGGARFVIELPGAILPEQGPSGA